MWHAGSYDPHDFLGRLIGEKAWVRHAEKSMFWCYDHNYFATEFNQTCLLQELLKYKGMFGMTGRDIPKMQMIILLLQVGPMEYMNDIPFTRIWRKRIPLFSP